MTSALAQKPVKQPGTVRVGFAEPAVPADGELSDAQLAHVAGGDEVYYFGIEWSHLATAWSAWAGAGNTLISDFAAQADWGIPAGMSASGEQWGDLFTGLGYWAEGGFHLTVYTGYLMADAWAPDSYTPVLLHP
jgi:hypothetical protein